MGFFFFLKVSFGSVLWLSRDLMRPQATSLEATSFEAEDQRISKMNLGICVSVVLSEFCSIL